MLERHDRSPRLAGPFAGLLVIALAAASGCGGDAPAGAAAALERGRELARSGRHAEAIAAYREGLAAATARADDRSVELELALARSLFALERYGEAQALLQGAATAHESDADVALLLGLVQLKLAQLEPAARELRRAAELDPRAADAHFYLGRALFERSILFLGGPVVDQERLDRSIEAFERAVALEPERADFRYRAALAYDRKNEPAEAIRHLEEAARSAPGHVEVRRTLGALLVKAGELERGRAELEAALELAPDQADSHYELGLALEEAGDRATARKAYETAVALKPPHAQAWFRLSDVLRRAGETEAADDALSRFELWKSKEEELDMKRLAAMAEPGDPVKQMDLGLVLLDLGRFDEARTSLRRSLELHAANPRAWYALGEAQWSQGDLAAARVSFEEVRRLEPENPAPLLPLARMCHGLKDYAAAREAAQARIAARPDDSEARTLLADLLVRANERDAAREELETAIELDPENDRAKKMLAALRAQGGEEKDG